MFSSAYTQGSTHIKCDDKAIDVENGVVICDGCSGSKYGDIAAGIISYLISKGIQSGLIPSYINNNVLSEYILHYGSSLFTDKINGALDSTVFTIIPGISINRIFIYGLGDGYVLVKYKDNTSIFVSIKYSMNYPMYVSYLMDRDMLASFCEIPQTKTVNIISRNQLGDIVTHIPQNELSSASFNLHLDMDKVDTIAVFSDGLGTFSGSESDEDCNYIAEELVAFKTRTRGMAERRLAVVLKKHGKPMDDLSIGVWVNECNESTDQSI